jgi:hypothetical protein
MNQYIAMGEYEDAQVSSHRRGLSSSCWRIIPSVSFTRLIRNVQGLGCLAFSMHDQSLVLSYELYLSEPQPVLEMYPPKV